LEKKRSLLPSNFKRSYAENNLSMEDILMNLSILKNPQQNNESSNLNITQEKLIENDSMSNSILQNNSTINVNVNVNVNFNMNRSLLRKNQSHLLNSKQNNLTKVATSIIIDENLPILNQKLKKANDYYNSKNNNNNELKEQISMDNVSEINLDRTRSPIRMRFNNSEMNNNRSLHVSGYIKSFINQAHDENYFDENEDIFKLKNCKINSKGKKFIEK